MTKAKSSIAGFVHDDHIELDAIDGAAAHLAFAAKGAGGTLTVTDGLHHTQSLVFADITDVNQFTTAIVAGHVDLLHV